MKTIAFYNNKGGIGKTTFSVHVALYAAKRLFRVRGGQGLRAKTLFAKRALCATRDSMHRSSASPLLGV